MTRAETLQTELLTALVDERFTEAVLRFRDSSRLCFCHRVDERWAKAVGPDECKEEREEESGIADELLSAMTMFRLNPKHLDIQFSDGSRWDKPLQELNRPNR